MDNKNRSRKQFLGTYFDPSFVLKLSAVSKWLGWIVLLVYAADFIVATMVMVLQVSRGFWQFMGITDVLTSILITLERPFRGLVYSVVLIGISEVLKIFVDIENNTRRAARK